MSSELNVMEALPVSAVCVANTERFEVWKSWMVSSLYAMAPKEPSEEIMTSEGDKEPVERFPADVRLGRL